ncbi:MAG: hypothetical protein GY873_21395 [Bosea sp.]|uniref:hypothetical protein n=1 Tax=Bosea sp. (in: a-proteobacteria) TaxID=1871050 RepID=UPI00239625E5|nr:hypothetical protein [Bosea sp. (in: a-proteobacteria)]MCP4736744.1 hypothetical protein [Bosea sp. (in: a-proteobacteria)]
MARLKGELKRAVSRNDDEEIWRLCANSWYSEAAYSRPRDIWSEIKECIEIGDESAIAAISSCIVEHMLQVDFEYFAREIKIELDKGNVPMADCMSTCGKFGQSLLPENSNLFDLLKQRSDNILELNNNI